MAEAVQKIQPQIILASSSSVGKDLFPRVSAKLNAGVASDCTELQIDGDSVTVKKPVYSGKVFAKVTFEKTTYNELPFKFEAGTPHIAGAICLGRAIEYLNQFNIEDIEQHELALADYAQDLLLTFEGLHIIGESKHKTSVVSFVVDGVHPFDLGTLLDKQGIAVRTGHHCTQPLMDFYKIPGTVRASFAFYNTKEEIDIFIQAFEKALGMLK
jgi:cysteine desulfurase/selenocysteine lyase